MLGIISLTSGLKAILGAVLVEPGWCQHTSLPTPAMGCGLYWIAAGGDANQKGQLGNSRAGL
jgi:hypothetical protein